MQRLTLSLFAMLLVFLIPLLACDAQGTPQVTIPPEQVQDLATIAAQAGVEVPDPATVTGQTPGPTITPAGRAGTPTPVSEASSAPEATRALPPTPLPAHQTSAETDRAALEAVYEALGGENWFRQDNWLSNKPLNEWIGVFTEDGRVVALRLEKRNLTGTLPDELWELTRLRELHFEGNPGLTGGLPAGVGSLTELEYLDLTDTGLSGELPPEVESLRQKGLERIGILWTGLCVPPQLEETVLSILSHRSARDSTGGWLCEERAKLEAVYEALGGENWNRQDNWLSNKPLSEWIGVDTEDGRVVALWLEKRNLTGTLPDALWELTRLKRLDLWGNPGLTGALPAGIGRLTELEYLDLTDTGLSGELPPEVESLRQKGLERIGILWTGLCVPPQLEETVLSILSHRSARDSTGGWLCEERAKLEAVYEALGGENWNRQDNWLSNKPLSEWIGVDTEDGRVVALWLEKRNLTGTLPDALWELTRLRQLHLSDNPGLTGGLPDGIGRLTELEYLDLRGTGITGCVPVALRANLNSQSFGDDWCAETKLVQVGPDDSGGGVQSAPTPTPPPRPTGTPTPPRVGPTPEPSPCDGIGGRYDWTEKECAVALGIIRDRNGLSAIHAATDTHTDWEAIVAKFNGGRSPDDAGYCYFPADYSLPLDKWCDVITDHNGRVWSLDLGGMGAVDGKGWGIGLNGTIPSALAGLDALWKLDLSDGKVCGRFGCRGGLTGRIPHELGLLPKLESLDLSGNELEGSVYSMSCLPKLQFLDLSNNRFRYGATKFLGNPCNVENPDLTTEIRLGRNPWSGEPREVRETISDDDEVIIIQRGFIDLTKSVAGQLGVPTDVQNWAKEFLKGQSADLIAYGRHVNFQNRGAAFVVRFAGELARAYPKVVPVVGWVSFGTDTAFTLYNMTRATVELLEGVREAREVQSKKFTGTYALCELEWGWATGQRPPYADEVLRDRCD